MLSLEKYTTNVFYLLYTYIAFGLKFIFEKRTQQIITYLSKILS